MTYTITPDNEDIHIRAIVRGPAELQELIDKLIATKEKISDRPDTTALPDGSVSDAERSRAFGASFATETKD